MAALAERQEAMVSTEQLRALGLDRGAIAWRVRRRRLTGVHRGVYAVGPPRRTWRARLWAAVLACGGPHAAVLSHRTAAALWDLRHAPMRIEVTTLHQSRSTKTIRVYRGRLEPHEITTLDGLPLTTPMRALLDLATIITAHDLERAVHRAAQLRLLDAGAVPPGRRGARRLREAIATIPHDEPRITRSDLEEAFLKLVNDFDLPPPLTNHPVNGHEVDAYWPEHRLIVELDSRRWHLNPIAFEDDRERDAEHILAGDRVVRLTYRHLTARAALTAARLRALTAGTRPAPSWQ